MSQACSIAHYSTCFPAAEFLAPATSTGTRPRRERGNLHEWIELLPLLNDLHRAAEVQNHFQCNSVAHYSIYFPAAEFRARATPTPTRAWIVAAAGAFCWDDHSEEDVHSGDADERAGCGRGGRLLRVLLRRSRRRQPAPAAASAGACPLSSQTDAMQLLCSCKATDCNKYPKQNNMSTLTPQN